MPFGSPGGQDFPRKRHAAESRRWLDEELEAIEVESNHIIEIDLFVPRGQIDQRFLDSPYYIGPNDPVAQEGEAVHAVVMRKPGTVVTEGDLIEFCKARIAHYKCPRSVKIQDDMLPLSGAGKISNASCANPIGRERRGR